MCKFVLEVMGKFGLKFHQLTPSCFTKLSIFVGSCNSQGVDVDVDAFLRMHRVHTQPSKCTIGDAEVFCQFGVYTFVYHHGAVLSVQAQKNKWASEWPECWFYYKLEAGDSFDLVFYSDLLPLGAEKAEGTATQACNSIAAALTWLAPHLCAWDLFQEFLCAKVMPLRVRQ